MASGNISIAHDPTDREKDDIVRAYFSFEQDEVDSPKSDLEEFFACYRTEIEDLRSGQGTQWKVFWTFSITSHQQVMELVRYLRTHLSTSTRDEARMHVRRTLSLPLADNFDAEDRVIYLSLRLWLRINFRLDDESGVGQGRPCVGWEADDTLMKKIQRVFQKSSTELPMDRRRLNPNFKAANMVKICGLRIEWTSGLEDHLYLDREKRTLWVFEKRRWLRFSSRAKACPLPVELLEETSATLDLLFPSWDSQTRALLRKRQQDFHHVYQSDRVLDLRQYHYWRDRLLELYEDIYLAPAEGLIPLWIDDRDPQKFWTFWTTLLILFLTILSFSATLLQTYVALRTLNQQCSK